MESEVDEESQDSQIVDIIPIRFETNYGGVHSVSQPVNSSANKGKYYKQTYRTAWEQMPDFKGWLRGVQGEPTRAYCIYCQKTLHAHRLSLLKHTCTIRHQKAAQLHSIRKHKVQYMESSQKVTVLGATSSTQEGGDGQDVEHMVEYADADQSVSVVLEDDDNENDMENDEEDDDDSETIQFDNLPSELQKQFRQKISNMSTQKPPISTHVLDTSKGNPVSGLQVSLYKLIDGRWTYMNEGITNPDGRFASFLERSDFTPGRYKLHYDVDRYFEARKQDSLYPFIEIVFDCRASTDHYHIPLLLSPFGYTTYRGS